jgi:hypothetical protein
MVSQLRHYHGLNSLNHIGRVGINDYSSCLTVSQAGLGVLLERFFSNRGTRKVLFNAFSYIDAKRRLRHCSSGGDFEHFGDSPMTRQRLTPPSGTKPEQTYVDHQPRIDRA